jgi:hypothetical protein
MPQVLIRLSQAEVFAAVLREAHPEARTFAFDGVHAVLHLHQFGAARHHRQPQPVAGAVDFPRQFRAVVRGEDFAFLFVGDAHAGVPHFHQALGAAWADGDQHAALLRIAQGVLDQVDQRLPHQQRIAHHADTPSRPPGAQRQGAAVGLFAEQGDYRVEQGADIHMGGGGAHVAGFDLAEIEQ